jgi:hypothetical protein
VAAPLFWYCCDSLACFAELLCLARFLRFLALSVAAGFSVGDSLPPPRS